MAIESGLVTWLFPCVTFGQIAEIVDRGSTTCGGSAALYTLIAVCTGAGGQCIYSCFYRSKMRAQYGLEESPCPDWGVHLCCEPCALCQEYRELNNRGFQMTIDGTRTWRRKRAPPPSRRRRCTPPGMTR